MLVRFSRLPSLLWRLQVHNWAGPSVNMFAIPHNYSSESLVADMDALKIDT
jgi:hypothetical protein